MCVCVCARARVCRVNWVLLYHSSATGQAVVLLLGVMQVQRMKLKQKDHDMREKVRNPSTFEFTFPPAV